MGLGPVVVLVPIKSFALAKVRLAPALNPLERAAAARALAHGVLLAAAPLPVAVVCDDPEVAHWARARGAVVLQEPGRGLNGAVAAGVEQLAARGAEQVVVAHADLPLARSFEAMADFPGVTLAPDRRRDGTNVICLPTDVPFRFSYGPGSFERHLAEARRVGRGVRILHEGDLAWDVDVPDDLFYVTPA